MNKKKVIRRKLDFEIEYLPAERDNAGRVVSSGILVSTKHIENELRIDISNDPMYDEDEERFVNSGKYQINLTGTRKAFQELGTLLLALAHYEEDPDYHIHIDEIQGSRGQVSVHLIIHVPVDMDQIAK